MIPLSLALVLAIILETRGDMEGNIVGGEYVTIYDAPHSVFIYAFGPEDVGVWCCGGSVLNQRLVLTAAHCLDNLQPGRRVDVFAGDANIEKAEIIRQVRRIIQHKEYDRYQGIADIGLILVGDRLPLVRNVQRVILRSSFPKYISGTVSGWGLTLPHAQEPSVRLKRVRQMVLHSSECINKYVPWQIGTMCAWSGSSRKYPMKGDSGGAFVTDYHQQIGIVSLAYRSKVNAIVYTNVSYYLKWITTKSKQLHCYIKVKG